MKQKNIKILTIKDLYEFVKEATSVYGDVICKRGKYAVDAKSLLGVMSIDFTDGVTVEYPCDAVFFEEYLAKFEN